MGHKKRRFIVNKLLSVQSFCKISQPFLKLKHIRIEVKESKLLYASKIIAELHLISQTCFLLDGT